MSIQRKIRVKKFQIIFGNSTFLYIPYTAVAIQLRYFQDFNFLILSLSYQNRITVYYYYAIIISVTLE